MKCGACGWEVSRAADSCPKCGHPMADRYLPIRVLLLVIAGVLVIGFAGRFMGVW